MSNSFVLHSCYNDSLTILHIVLFIQQILNMSHVDQPSNYLTLKDQMNTFSPVTDIELTQDQVNN
jgi:hypothetical protein